MESLIVLSGIELALVAVVLGLVQIFKSFVKDHRFYPIASVALALILEVLVTLGDKPLVVSDGVGDIILTGLVIGLSASGLYAGTKTVVNG